MKLFLVVMVSFFLGCGAFLTGANFDNLLGKNISVVLMRAPVAPEIIREGGYSIYIFQTESNEAVTTQTQPYVPYAHQYGSGGVDPSILFIPQNPVSVSHTNYIQHGEVLRLKTTEDGTITQWGYNKF